MCLLDEALIQQNKDFFTDGKVIDHPENPKMEFLVTEINGEIKLLERRKKDEPVIENIFEDEIGLGISTNEFKLETRHKPGILISDDRDDFFDGENTGTSRFSEVASYFGGGGFRISTRP